VKPLEKVSKIIELMSEWSGKTVAWVIIVQVIIINYEVVMRYFFNAPTIWSHVLSYLLGSTFVFLGMAYVWRHDANVRIDVFYGKFSPRIKAVTDNVFTIIFFFPLIFMLTKEFAKDTLDAYQVGERVWMAAWYPLLWPFKLAATVGFLLLSLQGIATFVKNIVVVISKNEERGLQ
jgi:TRAP-type mannitol/chloroaromatic compound transport system permease small subunit